MADAGWSDGIAVLGGGLAGLGFALEIPGVTVFEAQPHPGGHAYSHDLNGVYFDEGAHISHTADVEFLSMIRETAGEVHSGIPSIVRNYWKGHWTGYPIQNHLRDLPLEPRIQALTALVEAHTESGDPEIASYREWCVRQYGDFLTDEFYELFTRKYWRRSTSELATDWLGGRLIPSELANIVRGAFAAGITSQTKFAEFHYPAEGGFFRFFADLYEETNLRLNHRVVEIDLQQRTLTFQTGPEASFDHLATSIPLPDLIGMIKDAPRSIKDAAARLHHTKLLCVNILVDRPDVTDAHWVYVYDEEIEAARLSFPSNLSPTTTPGGQFAIQAEIFRDHREAWGDTDSLAAVAANQVGALLGFDGTRDVAAMTSITVPHAYVVSDSERANAAARIDEWLTSRGVYSMGLYGMWQYLWSDGAFQSGRATAQQVKAAHGHN